MGDSESLRDALQDRAGFEPTTPGAEVGSSCESRAQMPCLKGTRLPSDGPRLACVVTSSPTWSGRRGSNPRQPAWKEEGHPPGQA